MIRRLFIVAVLSLTACRAPFIEPTPSAVPVGLIARAEGLDADLRMTPICPCASGQAITFRVVSNDAGLLEWSWDWNNDGINDEIVHGPSPLTIRHAFTGDGQHYLRLRVYDPRTEHLMTITATFAIQ